MQSIFAKDRHEALNFMGKPSTRSIFTRVGDCTIREPIPERMTTDELYRELTGRPFVKPVDTETFNYGRAMGAPKAGSDPWNASDPGLQYQHAETFCRELTAIGNKFSAHAWALEMALRDVRNCETAGEQAEALKALQAMFLEVDKSTEQVGERVKFYRYGRLGNVLRNFKPQV